LLRLERRCEGAISEIEIALATDRNNPFALVELSMCTYLTGGSDQEAIALTEQAIRLSPRCVSAPNRDPYRIVASILI
jgi:hypothetical protein